MPINHDVAIEAFRTVLRFVGEDPNREGIVDTPKRWIAAMVEMTSGHDVDIAKLLSVNFDSGNYDEVICVNRIAYTSMCEHHLLPFMGHASVAYLPSQNEDGRFRVVGLSKLPRLVDAYARRLQLQEQLTVQIADAIDLHLKPRGVGVMLHGEHSCASCRGVRKAGMDMVTSVLRGELRTDAAMRAEVLSMMKGT